MFGFLRDLFEKPEDRWYREAKERSALLKIVKGDSKEVRAKKTVARKKVWREYDEKRDAAQADRIKSERDAYAARFFRDLAQDRDAIGFRVDLSSEACDDCRALAGIYKKGSRISISGHSTCNLSLSAVYSLKHGDASVDSER